MITKDLILQWLELRVGDGMAVIPTHVIEVELPYWAYQTHDIIHTPSTYSRIWRLMRENDDLPYIIEELGPDTDSSRKEKVWRIRRRHSMRSPGQSAEGTSLSLP
jgi:hypothetical protein